MPYDSQTTSFISSHPPISFILDGFRQESTSTFGPLRFRDFILSRPYEFYCLDDVIALGVTEVEPQLVDLLASSVVVDG